VSGEMWKSVNHKYIRGHTAWCLSGGMYFAICDFSDAMMFKDHGIIDN